MTPRLARGCRDPRLALPWLASLGLVMTACSAPTVDPDIVRAEHAERDGRHEEALRAYQDALSRCHGHRMSTPRRAACASAYLARAELLEHLDRPLEAARAYEGAPSFCPWDQAASAAGVYRAGRLYLELGRPDQGYTLLWRTVTDYPNEFFAGDALDVVVADGKKRDARELYRVLGQLLQPLSGTLVADNLLYALAQLSEEEFADDRAALAQYDKLVSDYPESTMRDDALWHGARLARALGDGRGAVARLERLLATREVTIGPGSYFSVWLDNAQLELGRVLRDDLREYQRAIAAFARLPEHYPASVLRDDALFETALTWERMQRPADTCRALARLAREWPDSKYQLEQAPALARRNDCSEAAAPP